MRYRAFLDLGVWPGWRMLGGRGGADRRCVRGRCVRARRGGYVRGGVWRPAWRGPWPGDPEGAYFVIDGMEDMPEILEEIEGALARDEQSRDRSTR